MHKIQLSSKKNIETGMPKGTLFIVHSLYRIYWPPEEHPYHVGGMWIRTSIEAAESLMHDLLVDEIEDLDAAWKIGVNALLLDGKVYAAEYLYRQSMLEIEGRDATGMYIVGIEGGNCMDYAITADNRDNWVSSTVD